MPIPLPTAGRSWVVATDPYHTTPIDSGCDLARYDARFSRCLSCPLPVCIRDLSPVEARTFRAALARLTASAG